VCATESRAHPNFKTAFIKASARDAIVSVQLDKRFPVIPVRALKNQGMDDFVTFQRHVIDEVDRGALTLKEGQLKIEHYWAGALRRAVMDGDVDTGSLMCGQSVGMVTREESVADILADLVG
jgi:enoyl-[acyl-carrier protein] reductase II